MRYTTTMSEPDTGFTKHIFNAAMLLMNKNLFANEMKLNVKKIK